MRNQNIIIHIQVDGERMFNTWMHKNGLWRLEKESSKYIFPLCSVSGVIRPLSPVSYSSLAFSFSHLGIINLHESWLSKCCQKVFFSFPFLFFSIDKKKYNRCTIWLWKTFKWKCEGWDIEPRKQMLASDT